MHNYEYIGCFFDPEELFRKLAHIRNCPLQNQKPKPHITFCYAPETVQEELFGQPVSVTVTAYGNDGINEGVKVCAKGAHPAIDEMIEKIPVPHITLAVSDGGKAVDTRYLQFSPVQPIELTGYFGGHIDEDTDKEKENATVVENR